MRQANSFYILMQRTRGTMSKPVVGFAPLSCRAGHDTPPYDFVVACCDVPAVHVLGGGKAFEVACTWRIGLHYHHCVPGLSYRCLPCESVLGAAVCAYRLYEVVKSRAQNPSITVYLSAIYLSTHQRVCEHTVQILFPVFIICL